MSQPLQHSMILTRLTETGQALIQLNSRGYVDIDAARKHPYVRRMRPTIRRGDGTPWAY